MSGHSVRIKIRDWRGTEERMPPEMEMPSGTGLGDFLETLPLAGGPGYYTILLNGRPAERKITLQDGDEITILPLSVGG